MRKSPPFTPQVFSSILEVGLMTREKRKTKKFVQYYGEDYVDKAKKRRKKDV